MNQTTALYLYKQYGRRGLKEISFEDFLKLTSSNCFYCGAPPSNIRLGRGKGIPPYVYNGLDKVVPSRGYILSNVVPCCWPCNHMKSDFPQGKFLSHVRKIVYHLDNDKKSKDSKPHSKSRDEGPVKD